MRHLLLLVTSYLFLSSCIGDECKGREDRLIDLATKNTIPYIEGQTYNFISSENEEFSIWVERIEETLVPDFPLICEDYLELRLKKPDGELFVDIIMRGSIQENLVQVSIFAHGQENGVIAQYQVNDDGSFSGVLPHDTYTFHENIMIDSSLYEDVIELNYPDFLEENDVDQVYYNAEIGLIKVISKGGYSIRHI